MIKDNKVSTYLLYATGEIVLVVIGILIALGVNNWNQGRKEDNKELYFLKELREEFNNDKKMLASFISLTNGKTNDGKLIKKYLNGLEVDKDTIIKCLFFNGKTLIFKSFTPIYDEIVATGQTGIIKNDSLKGLIKDYKSYITNLDSFLYKESTAIKNNYNFHLYKYFDHEIMTIMWDWGRNRRNTSPLSMVKGLKQDFEGFKNDSLSYYYVSMTVGTDSELSRSYTQSLMPRLGRVLNALEKELDHE